MPNYDAIAIDYMIKIIENGEDHPGYEVCRHIPEKVVPTLIDMLKDYKQLKSDYIDLDRQFRGANSRADARWLQVGTDIYECSECGARLYGATVEKLVDTEHSCYMCGAKMEVEHDDKP